MLSIFKRATRSVVGSSSRSLATVVSLPTFPKASSLDSSNKFIVPSKTTISTPAPRYSAKSSRMRASGRSPIKLANQLRPDEDKSKLVGQVLIHLPSVFIRLVRNTAEHEHDPFTATFRTDVRLTKPDITNYLKNIYGLAITSIRTINYLAAVRRNSIGGGYSRAGSTKNYKKVMVTMEQPFWYPEEKARDWCNEHFERDRMEEMRDRKMLKIGDGQKFGVSSNRYRGAHKSKVEVARLAKIVADGGLDVKAVQVDDIPSVQRRPAGLRKHKNVMRSKAERASTAKDIVDQKVADLRSAGW